MDKAPRFLREKYGLEDSPEVRIAARHQEADRADQLSKDERVQLYLDRLSVIFGESAEDPQEEDAQDASIEDRQNGAVDRERFMRMMHRRFIINPEIATNTYIEHEQRLGRERGHGDLQVPDDLRQRLVSAVQDMVAGKNIEKAMAGFRGREKQIVEEVVAKIEAQRSTLDRWVDYLSSSDALYPDWLKYWAIRSVTGLAGYDKDEGRFPPRSKDTLNPFPDLNMEALARVLDAIKQQWSGSVEGIQLFQELQEDLQTARVELLQVKKRLRVLQDEYTNKQYDGETEGLKDLQAQIDEAQTEVSEVGQTWKKAQRKLTKAINADFATLYAHAIEKITPVNAELLTNTQGEWVKYDQRSDHLPLVKSLQGHGTGWCTAGVDVARSQLARGDFYVYYSQDEEGNSTIPRAAIRMEGDTIAEVRGIARDQNLDPYIGEVVKEKMGDFPDGEAYEKKASDMKRLTEIDRRVQQGEELDKDDLRFLYEIDGDIKGFGYEDDPRVDSILDERDPYSDYCVIFDGRVVRSQNEIAPTTELLYGDFLVDAGVIIPPHIVGMVRFADKAERLPSIIAEGLTRAGRFETVMKNFERFSDVNLDNLADIAIHNGSARYVLKYLDFFPNVSHEALMVGILDSDGIGGIRQRDIQRLEGLSADLARRILTQEDGEHYLYSALDSFVILPSDIAKELEIRLGTPSIALKFNRFEGVSADEILCSLIDEDYYTLSDWNPYLSKMSGFTSIAALKIISAGKELLFVDFLDKFEDLNSDVADFLFQYLPPDLLAKHAHCFAGLTHDQLSKLAPYR